MRKIIIFLFLLLFASTGYAGEKTYEASLTTSLNSTGVYYSPNPGEGSISIVFSSGASGTMYLERKYTGDDLTGSPDWEEVYRWTSDDEKIIKFRGSRKYKYRFRSDMTSGTVYGLITQDDRDRDRW
jgi:hypothetical protein